MGSVLSIVIELTVVILLAVTVTYCIILDRKLQRLRADEGSIRKTVVDLGLATDRAERAIDGLKSSLADSENSLGEKLRSAEAASRELDATIRSGDEVLERIGKIVVSARRAVD
jgi:predicted nuclease of restriction endonuclease-like RecB superfamily